ncbi:hypothetical protein EV426DRAFT_579077 [Tirmania nivea]|nr:hypothetical protein EV426DRAFT_579077 [Tirmania nivea]
MDTPRLWRRYSAYRLSLSNQELNRSSLDLLGHGGGIGSRCGHRDNRGDGGGGGTCGGSGSGGACSSGGSGACGSGGSGACGSGGSGTCGSGGSGIRLAACSTPRQYRLIVGFGLQQQY